MLVARATFDGEELPPSHPIRLYRELVASIAYPDDPRTGLAPLFDRLVDKLGAEAAAKLPPNRWLTPALWARTHCADPDLVGDAIAWASGEPVWLDDLRADLERRGWRGPSLLALPDYRTFGQIMAHLLGAVAVWAREAGYGGLSVLLDEAEYIDKLGATSREMAENVLRYLAVATLPSRQLGFDPERMYRGGQQVHRAVPTRFADDQPLVALFAFTPNPEVDRVIAGISVGGSAVRPLDAIGRAHLGALVEAVVDLVCAAHPGVEVGNVDRDNLRRAALKAHDEGLVENTRDVAKMAVYWMDLHRHDPLRARRALR
jgi:GNAT superfamily N-acetyltransferase